MYKPHENQALVSYVIQYDRINYYTIFNVNTDVDRCLNLQTCNYEQNFVVV